MKRFAYCGLALGLFWFVLSAEAITVKSRTAPTSTTLTSRDVVTSATVQTTSGTKLTMTDVDDCVP